FDDLVRRGENGVLDLRRAPLAPDEALRRIDRVLGVRDRLPLGDVPDESLSRFGDCDHRGRRLVAAPVGNDGRNTIFDHRDARIRRTEIDADDTLHPFGVPPRFACYTKQGAEELRGRWPRAPKKTTEARVSALAAHRRWRRRARGFGARALGRG